MQPDGLKAACKTLPINLEEKRTGSIAAGCCIERLLCGGFGFHRYISPSIS
jgi:hypothetical protein